MRFRSIIRVATSACNVTLFGSIVALGALCTSQPAYAQGDSSTHETEKLAKKLVNKFWKDVEHQDVKAYSKLLAPHFQGINISGAYTRAQQISGLKGLTVTSFKITKLIASRFQDTLVISYDFTAQGMGIVSGPSVDIWHKKDQKWKQISHTYVPFQ
jgi:hypothetical protein